MGFEEYGERRNKKEVSRIVVVCMIHEKIIPQSKTKEGNLTLEVIPSVKTDNKQTKTTT